MDEEEEEANGAPKEAAERVLRGVGEEDHVVEPPQRPPDGEGEGDNDELGEETVQRKQQWVSVLLLLWWR